MTAHDFTGAPCLTNPPLWESTWPADHEQAKKGCRVCGHVAACLERLALARELAGYHDSAGSGPEGTWAGLHINPRKKQGRPRKERAA